MVRNILTRGVACGAFLIAALFSTTMAAAQSSSSQTAVGTVDFLEPDVEIVRNGEVIVADFGTELFLDDTVRTGPDALAIISLRDGSQIKLRADTTIRMDTLPGGASVQLQHGGLFARVNQVLSGPRRFEVRTPTTVAGVRGTEFFVAYGRTVEDAPDLWLCVNEGSVQVDVLTTNQTTIVNEGEGINVLGGVRATDPRFFQWTTLLNWNFNPQAGDVRDETDLDAAYGDLLDQDYD